MKLALAGAFADPQALIDRQRRTYLQALHDLDRLAVNGDADGMARLLVEGAALHLEADLVARPVRAAARAQGGHHDRRLEGRRAEKTYRDGGIEVQALRGVDLDVEPGEFVSVMGPSGCGKSTLLHLLGGLDRPTAATIKLDGARVDQLSETRWALLRRRSAGLRLPELQPDPEPVGRRQRRAARARGRSVDGRGAAPARAAARRARRRRQGRLRPVAALGRPAAAGRHGPRVDQPPGAAAGRRAHRQPRQHQRAGAPAAAARAGVAGPDDPAGHPRRPRGQRGRPRHHACATAGSPTRPGSPMAGRRRCSCPTCSSWKPEMLAVIVRTTRAGLRGHAWQSLLAGLIVAAAAATMTLALDVRRSADDPFDRVFAATRGPHVMVGIDPSRVAQLQRLRAVPGIAARTPMARAGLAPARVGQDDTQAPAGRAALERRRGRPPPAAQRALRRPAGRSGGRADLRAQPAPRARRHAPDPRDDAAGRRHRHHLRARAVPALGARARLGAAGDVRRAAASGGAGLRRAAPARSRGGRRHRRAGPGPARAARRRLGVHQRPQGRRRRHALGGAGARGVQPVRADHGRPDPGQHDRREGALPGAADRDLQGPRLHAAAGRRHAAGRAADDRPDRCVRGRDHRDAGRAAVPGPQRGSPGHHYADAGRSGGDRRKHPAHAGRGRRVHPVARLAGWPAGRRARSRRGARGGAAAPIAARGPGHAPALPRSRHGRRQGRVRSPAARRADGREPRRHDGDGRGGALRWRRPTRG